MDIYTAQIRYSGADRLDVTVKGQDPFGKFFAPTWDMVRGTKNGTLSEGGYRSMYYGILLGLPPAIWSGFQGLSKPEGTITLMCYCPAGAFCHRVILAEVMENRKLGEYKGERKL